MYILRTYHIQQPQTLIQRKSQTMLAFYCALVVPTFVTVVLTSFPPLLIATDYNHNNQDDWTWDKVQRILHA
jgi:hypothetical protein